MIRPCAARAARGEQRLRPVEQLASENSRRIAVDVLACGFNPMGPRVLDVEAQPPGIDRIAQKSVDPPVPQRPPVRVVKPRSLSQVAMALIPIGPDCPSPSRNSRKMSRTCSASTGSMTSFFLTRAPRRSASAVL
jgi:hypothetical protein